MSRAASPWQLSARPSTRHKRQDSASSETKADIPLDPVDAYSLIAPEYARISEKRRAYLARVEQIIIGNVPAGAASLLDVGAGDGTRSARIAKAAGIRRLVLLEPSAGMRQQLHVDGAEVWTIRAEELSSKTDQFDVITCLWNVLGHIFPEEARVEVLRQCGRLLSPGGLLFVDVSHRHNLRHYGLRVLRQADVIARWKINGEECATPGHVFTDVEFLSLAFRAGLALQKKFVVDYASGEIRRSKFSGHLLYVLSRRERGQLR